MQYSDGLDILPPDTPVLVKQCYDYLAAQTNEDYDEKHSSSLSIPLFKQQQDGIIQQIRRAKKHRHPLLVEGCPGIGKSAALLQYIHEERCQRPAIRIKLAEALHSQDKEDFILLPIGGNTTSTSNSSDDGFLSVVNDAFGITAIQMEQAYTADGQPILMTALSLENHVTDALRLVRRNGSPCLLVIDDVHLLFSNREPFFPSVRPIFEWLLQCESQGLLDVVLCSSSKSVLPCIKTLRGFDSRLRFRSVEPIADAAIIDYILDDLNPSLQDQQRCLSEDDAHLFVQMFDGNLQELSLLVASSLSVKEFVAQREAVMLEYLQNNIPSLPPGQSSTTTSPYEPRRDQKDLFREIILEMIMTNGVLALQNLDMDKLRLIELLVECNYLRWKDTAHQRRKSSASQRKRMASLSSVDAFSDVSTDPPEEPFVSDTDRLVEEQLMNDPFFYLRRGDTELVWYNRLVGNVCEKWFSHQMW